MTIIISLSVATWKVQKGLKPPTAYKAFGFLQNNNITKIIGFLRLALEVEKILEVAKLAVVKRGMLDVKIRKRSNQALLIITL